MRRLSAGLLVLASCKTVPHGSALKTDETRASLLSLCDQDWGPEGVREELLEAACACGKAKGVGEAACERLPRAMERFTSILRTESDLVLRDSRGNQPSAADRQCAEGLIALNEESYLEEVVESCKRDDGTDLRTLLDLEISEDAQSCWRLTRMDENGCIVATPCPGTGASSLAALPLATSDSRLVPEGREVTLCNERIQVMHRLKDPTGVTQPYNYPFANLIGFNRSSRNITYGAANCHGTAQAVAGGFLGNFPVTKLSYHSPWLEAECREQVASAVSEARAKAEAAGETGTPARFFPIERGGYVINMNHDPQCSETDCGIAEFLTFSCKEGLEAHIFIHTMCINCWDRLIREQGYQRLSASEGWRALRPGCLMTANDHSIALVMQNDGMCYYYESTTPFGAPQLRVQFCPTLRTHFKRAWCPEEPLAFTLGS